MKLPMIVAIIVSVQSPVVFGFALSRHDVPTNPLHFYIDLDSSFPNLGYSANALFSGTLDRWNMLLTPNYQLSGENKSHNTCAYDEISGVSTSPSPCILPDSWDGIRGIARTRTSVMEGIVTSEVDIQISPYIAEKGNAEIVQESTFLHEIGHALGLSHSIFPDSLMLPGAGLERRYLTVDEHCGMLVLRGDPEECAIFLKDAVITNDTPTDALFFGGATLDDGVSYQELVSSDATISVFSTMVVDRRHRLQLGAKHFVATTSQGRSYAMNEAGEFIDWNESQSLPSAGRLAPAYSFSIDQDTDAYETIILRDIDLSTLGLEGVTVYFYTGYSLDSDPGTIIYSETPIVVEIGP